MRSLSFIEREGDSLVRVVLPVDDDALNEFQAWREDHFRASGNVAGLMASAFGKMLGLALRLALVLEHLAWAAGADGVPEPKSVSRAALGAALDLVEGYFKPMLHRTLGEAAQPKSERDAAILARAIVVRKPTAINLREVRRDWRLPGLSDSKTLEAAAQALVDAKWLQPIGTAPGQSGRHRSDYAVHLAVRRRVP